MVCLLLVVDACFAVVDDCLFCWSSLLFVVCCRCVLIRVIEVCRSSLFVVGRSCVGVVCSLFVVVVCWCCWLDTVFVV